MTSLRADELAPPQGATHKKRRVGRGDGSGLGTYSGKGLKGQKSRSGKTKPYAAFEGGQFPGSRRFARLRGFNNRWRIPYQPVNVGALERFDADSTITPETLRDAGILRHLREPVKVLGEGELTRKLNVSAHGFSASAKTKIEQAGGTVTVIGGNEETEAQ